MSQKKLVSVSLRVIFRLWVICLESVILSWVIRIAAEAHFWEALSFSPNSLRGITRVRLAATLLFPLNSAFHLVIRLISSTPRQFMRSTAYCLAYYCWFCLARIFCVVWADMLTWCLPRFAWWCRQVIREGSLLGWLFIIDTPARQLCLAVTMMPSK